MTSGSRHEIVGLSRSIGVFDSVWAYSGVLPVMRWVMIEKVSGITALWAGFALLLSLCGGWYGWAALPPTLTQHLQSFR
jgi:hypothetical protein